MPRETAQSARTDVNVARLSAPETMLSQPVFRLLLIAFVFIALVPVCILAVEMHRAAWENAEREIHEKHKLLAENLAAPIKIYVDDHLEILSHLANELNPDLGTETTDQKRMLGSAFSAVKGFRSLSLLDQDGTPNFFTHRNISNQDVYEFPLELITEQCFIQTRDSGNWAISAVKRSPYTNDPTIFMSQAVKDNAGNVAKVLLAELRLEMIEDLRRGIKFGKKGHSAIVDNKGQVIAHPKREWALEIRDLSGISVVQRTMRGETGVAEFYSPFVGEQMVTGFASVPEINWGVLVPQPRSEIDDQVGALLYSHYLWAIFGLILAILLAIPIARWITMPINRLAAAAKLLTVKDFGSALPRLPSGAPTEVQQLAAAFRSLLANLHDSKKHVNDLNRSLQARVEASTIELRKANAQLERMAKADYLTNLANRRHFEQELRIAVDGARAHNEQHALLYMDIDQFKVINDTCGHLAGDELLRQLANALCAHVRREDMVARLGGDEFAVLIRKCTLEKAYAVAETLCESIADVRFAWRQRQFRVSLSIGMVMITRHSTDLTSVLQAADTSCYSAKEAGRNRVCLYREEDGEVMRRHGEGQWMSRLTEAIDQNKFYLHYQAIVPISGRYSTTHYELLLRLRDERGTVVPPGAFLPAAERYNFMPQIDRWVVHSAFSWLAKHEHNLKGAGMLFVNLSGQSLADERFAEFVIAKCSKNPKAAKRLCFEVTETAAIVSLRYAVEVMSTLRKLGCKFALDDFGTGMSSFAYLKELPVDILKIDGGFVRRITRNKADFAFVKSINDIGHVMGKVTVAESVASAKVMTKLREIGVDYAQGFCMGMTRPLADIQKPILIPPSDLAA